MELSTALAVLPRKIAHRAQEAALQCFENTDRSQVIWRVAQSEAYVDGWIVGLESVEIGASAVQVQAAAIVRKGLLHMLAGGALQNAASKAIVDAWTVMMESEGLVAAEVGENLSGGDENGPGKIDLEPISGGQERNKGQLPTTVPDWKIDAAEPRQMPADAKQRFADARARLQGRGQATGWDDKSR